MINRIKGFYDPEPNRERYSVAMFHSAEAIDWEGEFPSGVQRNIILESVDFEDAREVAATVNAALENAGRTHEFADLLGMEFG